MACSMNVAMRFSCSRRACFDFISCASKFESTRACMVASLSSMSPLPLSWTRRTVRSRRSMVLCISAIAFEVIPMLLAILSFMTRTSLESAVDIWVASLRNVSKRLRDATAFSAASIPMASKSRPKPLRAALVSLMAHLRVLMLDLLPCSNRLSCSSCSANCSSCLASETPPTSSLSSLRAEMTLAGTPCWSAVRITSWSAGFGSCCSRWTRSAASAGKGEARVALLETVSKGLPSPTLEALPACSVVRTLLSRGWAEPTSPSTASVGFPFSREPLVSSTLGFVALPEVDLFMFDST